MGTLSPYIISYASLKVGMHTFAFELNDSFFSQFPEGIIQKGKLDVQVQMERKSNMLQFHFTIKGNVEVPCDRCLENYTLKQNFTEELFVKFGHEYNELEENVVMIPESDHQFDLSQYMYEYVHLQLPLRKVHPGKVGASNGCNADMIKMIKNINGESETQTTDPRWDSLKNLLS